MEEILKKKSLICPSEQAAEVVYGGWTVVFVIWQGRPRRVLVFCPTGNLIKEIPAGYGRTSAVIVLARCMCQGGLVPETLIESVKYHGATDVGYNCAVTFAR